ncbi:MULTISPECIES: helix-turn-helix domain-containing protein [unclassified Nocardia]|uniref:GbsR/MarR family transcriptional regulator n=1 Tax=unclassified Nocardia TaxID=2637762 RepID=UPI001CE42868|nr:MULTISPECIES: helix-turn-helix domain-containing protein [unclassified Nocardia]
MSGGRLTRAERKKIALGLADNLPYAAIARGLNRPTSTITREVMRNGGPTSYRADRAQRATEQRAHRRTQSAPRTRQPLAPSHGRDAAAVRRYEETFTTLLMHQGMPRTTARVLTCLFTSDAGSLTTSELVERLQISPPSVSKSIKFLEVQGLVRRESDERRRARYIVDDNVWYQSTIDSARGMAEVAEITRQGVEIFGCGTPTARRLEDMARFTDFISETILQAVARSREVLYPKSGTTQ